MKDSEFDLRVAGVRRFSRFYTRQIGVLQDHYLRSPFSLTQVRVVYELAHHDKVTATQLSNELGLDLGYVSRILTGFQKRGLLTKTVSKVDGRQALLSLTDEGKQLFAAVDTRSADEIGAMLCRLSPGEQVRLVRAMETVEKLLGGPSDPHVPYALRPHRPGDMGWVVQRHGALYAEEYGWDERFEALVAGIVAKFIEEYDPAWEHCWMAEIDGENVGSVFLVKASETVAKLRLLLVEPRARGLGLGNRLVQECIDFARAAGYIKMKLWTNSCLLAARHIYVKAGFVLTESEPHHSFGHDLVGETWELDL
jgi:DNA-binding MarR family transcriptional regulator/GNAT superfamily N-acetyltransferase